MKLQGRLLPRAENLSNKTALINSWDLMYIVQSLDEFKVTKKQSFSFSHFRK
jgi:hypothetical protein